MAEKTTGLTYHELKVALERFQASPGELETRQLEQVRHDALKTWSLENKALSSEEAAGVVVGDDRIDEAMGEVIARYDSEGAFLEDLTANGVSTEAFREGIARELRFDALLAKIAQDVAEPTKAEVKAYFDSHPDKFNTPEQREAFHILITINDDYADNTEDRAKERAEEVVKQAKANPGSFAELAEAHSECPTAIEGGRLGLAAEGMLYPELDKGLFTMEAGEITGPIQTEVGFHVLRLGEIHPARSIPFSEAKPRIKQALDAARRKTAQKAWLQRIGALGKPA
ncbi:MAG: nitrogen fixation protein NifM [Magnetovibrionaceae bacterium]